MRNIIFKLLSKAFLLYYTFHMKTRMKHAYSIRKPIRTGLCLLLAGLLSCPFVYATSGDLSQVSESIDDLKQQQKQSQEELDALSEENAILSDELRTLNDQLSSLAASLSDLSDQQSALAKEIASCNQELADAQASYDEAYQAMKIRIRYFYEQGNDSVLSVLLSSKNFADFLTRAQFVEDIYAYDRTMLTELSALQNTITQKQTQLADDQASLSSLAQSQQETLEQVQSVLHDLTAQMDANDQKIATTEDAIQEQEEQLAKQRAYEAQLEEKKAREDAARLEEIRKQEEALKEYTGDNDDTGDTGDAGEINEEDVALLAALIECEAGGESYEGKLAVGSVVINRMRSSAFPDTLIEVIYQNGQFSPVASGRFATVLARGATDSCVSAAREVLSGTITLNALYFRRNNGAVSGTVIGNHVFY